MIGEAVSHYCVLRKLGGGGMGVVYEAEDTRLGRKVALKFLPDEHLSERLARERFEREARAASALSHPHICTVFDVGEHEGRPFIAMELLEGATLARRIDGNAIGTDELLQWTIQITDALDVTHAGGIVHRDIKPGNVFITGRGDAKMLDFGIARVGAAVQPLDRDAETATVPPLLTSPGATPGTLAYMSPEQTLGKPLDARTDLFSLGVVMYEMATGRPPFDGSCAAALFNQILNRMPPAPQRLNPKLPDELGRIVLKCLEKDRDLRYQSARELLADLKRVQRDRSSGAGAAAATGGERRRRHWRRSALIGAALVTAAIAGWLWKETRRTPRPPIDIRPFTTDGGLKVSPQLSPDAEKIAYAWTGTADDNWDIYVKPVGVGTTSLRLTRHPDADWRPNWSPDGRQVAFVRETSSGGAIYVVPALGGQERKLVDLEGPVWRSGFRFVPSFAWSPDGRWLALAEKPALDRPARIVRLDLATLEKTPLTGPPGTSLGDSVPAVSPDGRTLAFVRESSSAWGNLDVWVQPLPGGDARQLSFLRYDFCGQLAWMPAGDEIVFTTGDEFVPGRVFRIRVHGGTPEWLAGVGDSVAFATIGERRMVYAKATRTAAEIWRMPGRKGSHSGSVAAKLISSSQDDLGPAYSPDGKRIAFQSVRGGNDNVWLSDADGRNPTQLTAFLRHAGAPRWSPDARKVVFDSHETGDYEIYVIDADGGVPRRLTREPSSDNLASFSSDGRFIYFSSDRSGRREIWRMPADGGSAVPGDAERCEHSAGIAGWAIPLLAVRGLSGGSEGPRQRGGRSRGPGPAVRQHSLGAVEERHLLRRVAVAATRPALGVRLLLHGLRLASHLAAPQARRTVPPPWPRGFP